MKLRVLTILVISLIPFLGIGQTNFPFNDPNLPIDVRVEDLLERLSVEEKVSILVSTAEEIERWELHLKIYA